MAIPQADQKIAAEYGVSPRTVYTLCNHHLTERIHWKKEGGAKVYTAEGAARLRSLLEAAAPGEQPPIADPDPEKKEGGPQPAAAASAGAADDEVGNEEQPQAATPLDLPAAVPLPIYRLHPNPTAVGVLRPAGGNNPPIPLDVRVRNNRALRRGQRLLCRPHPDGRWECCHHGQAVPLPPSTSAPLTPIDPDPAA